jgi:energy-coupling factor transporter ATP-binding protein EcfA2
MLTRIVSLNSKIYGKAAISLKDSNSIQLVGPNNVGKSTLIYALNFLFIIDGKKMSFAGNRIGDKETFHHYFPSINDSYLIFEVFKSQHYCILLKRNHESELEYYKFDSAFDEKYFLANGDGQQRILKFNEVEEKLKEAGLELSAFRNKTEVFNFIYQRGQNNQGVVWLSDTVVSDGLSNNFSKIYRYLINSKLITNRTLKDSLIIADNRDREGVNFSQKSRKDIVDLLKINEEIKNVRNIQKDFYGFRELVSQYDAKGRLLGEYVFAFNQHYEPLISEYHIKLASKKDAFEKARFTLNEELNPKKGKLDREIGGKESETKSVYREIERLKREISEIESFEDKAFLQEQLFNLEEERKKKEASVTRIEDNGFSSHKLEAKVLALTKESERLKRQIDNGSQQLIHNITSKQENKEVLNFILSEDFISLSDEIIVKKISKMGSSMALFDGKINLPEGLKKEIPSLDKLKEDYEAKEGELKEYMKLLEIALTLEEHKKNLGKIRKDIEEVKYKLGKIDSKPALEEMLVKQEALFKATGEEKDALEKDLSLLKEEIAKFSLSLPALKEESTHIETRIKEVNAWKEKVESIAVVPIPCETAESLDAIFAVVEKLSEEIHELKNQKERAFDNLKFKMKSILADEHEFIRFLEEEIACLPDKEKSIETILQAISTQFANPAYTLLNRYEEFKEFIANKFNTKLSDIKISNIESLKIELADNRKTIEDLKKISSIQDISAQQALDFGQADNLKVLNTLLDAGKKIDFEDLFDIELQITKDGVQKKVDLKEQIESDGTDRMIRLVIIMSIINRLAISSEENRIVLFIDEIATIDGANRRELFKFCADHHFIPICASPDETILDGFDRYILIFRPQRNKKVNISEGHPNVIIQERFTEEPKPEKPVKKKKAGKEAKKV